MVVVHKGVGKFCAMAYSPEGVLLGFIEDTCELQDFRMQVCQEHVKGYYLMFNGEKIEINEHANLSRWPKEFDYDVECSAEILKINLGYHKKENGEGVG